MMTGQLNPEKLYQAAKTLPRNSPRPRLYNADGLMAALALLNPLALGHFNVFLKCVISGNAEEAGKKVTKAAIYSPYGY